MQYAQKSFNESAPFKFAGHSQKSVVFNNCKVVSIDSSMLLPDYCIVKVLSEKGKIIILSQEDNTLNYNKMERIDVNKKYDFDLAEIDSITVFESDTTFNYNFKFNRVRIRDNGLVLYIDGIRFLEFEDDNLIPYKALNLNGLYYHKIKKE